jgi:protein-tyrosine phosphatase
VSNGPPGVRGRAASLTGEEAATDTLSWTVPEFVALTNFRDVGGVATRDGRRVRAGVVFRSAELSRVGGEAAAILRGIGIRRVYDLRTDEERADSPEREQLPAGVEYVVADVLRDAPAGNPAHLAPILADPRRAQEALGDGRALALFTHKYREFVTLDSARAAYHVLFTGLADAASLPAVFHCATGKDRTGWAAAALQLFLGVPEDVILEAFLASNLELQPVLEPFLDRFATAGGDRALIEPLLLVRSSYVETAIDEMRAAFGTVERYLELGLGVDLATQRRLRDVLVEDA